MDGQRFDALTRRLGRELPRRAALRAFFGAGAVVAATRVVTQEAVACTEFGLPCSTSAECCDPQHHACLSGHPTSVCGICKKADEACSTNQECCSGECNFGHFFSNCASKKEVSCDGRGCGKKKRKRKRRRRH